MKLKTRIRALEELGADDEVVRCIIVSVVNGSAEGPVEPGECIGLQADHRGQSLKITRREGESLAELDARAGDYRPDEGVVCWIRQYAGEAFRPEAVEVS